MLQLASPLAALVPTGLVCLSERAATSQGLLAYESETTPAWLVPILEAQGQAKVSQLTDRDLDALVIGHFQKAAINLGHERSVMDPTKQKLYADEVAKLLRERWHYLTRGEVEQVFRLGSLGQLVPPADRDGRPTEEVIYLSPKTVGIWLQRYKYQVKPLAMLHTRWLDPPCSELPPNHPLHAAWRISRVQQLLALEPRALRQLTCREGDFKNLLFRWLKAIGALGFRPKPAGFWDRVEALEKRQLRRAGQRPAEEYLLEVAEGKRQQYADRLAAGKCWRTLQLWLAGQRHRQHELPALLWPLALAVYSPPTP